MKNRENEGSGTTPPATPEATAASGLEAAASTDYGDAAAEFEALLQELTDLRSDETTEISHISPEAYRAALKNGGPS